MKKINKLFFTKTNAGYVTVACHEDGRACYIHETENHANPLEYLEAVAENHDFNSLYDMCESEHVYCGVYATEDFEKDCENSEIITSINFD